MAILNTLIFIVVGALLLLLAVPMLLVRLFRGGGVRNGEEHGWKRGWVNPKKREGDVTVSGDKPSDEDKIVGDNIGEYVDYEEVESNDKSNGK